MSTITIADIEALATQLEADEATKRAHLLRMIAGEARIVAVREPSAYKRRACAIIDADETSGSYPPAEEFADRTGPALVRVHGGDWSAVRTSGGYYHSWRATTSSPGLYVDRKGTIWGASYTGTGHYGQFAAHPGNHNVEIEIVWDRLDQDDLTLAQLEAVERHMRALAFPLTQSA
jgi:hypothetical protein